ncbi:MAG: undecaprenyl-diphosphatase UppP [Chloroflexi bacterium]|nr:undecaprenyl-diphosphatase UppP [Chloroflexota bacterium]
MNLYQSLLLGLIQGLTEFIPVSSTAHLLVAQKIFGIPASDATFSFLVIVQLGTVLSLVVYFWKDLWKILKAAFISIPLLIKRGAGKRNTGTLDADVRLGWFILIATIPALIAGYLLKDAVEALFQMPLLEAAIRLLAAALLMALAERLSKKDRPLEKMTWLDALVVGLFQVIAVFPGASRSGTTISGGMLRGLDRRSAACFAFLMSVPVMLAAGGYEMLDVLKMPDLSAFLLPLAVGFAAAAVAGWLAVKWLLGYLNRHSLYAFAAYCALAGSSVLAFHFFL